MALKIVMKVVDRERERERERGERNVEVSLTDERKGVRGA